MFLLDLEKQIEKEGREEVVVPKEDFRWCHYYGGDDTWLLLVRDSLFLSQGLEVEIQGLPGWVYKFQDLMQVVEGVSRWRRQRGTGVLSCKQSDLVSLCRKLERLEYYPFPFFFLSRIDKYC